MKQSPPTWKILVLSTLRPHWSEQYRLFDLRGLEHRAAEHGLDELSIGPTSSSETSAQFDRRPAVGARRVSTDLSLAAAALGSGVGSRDGNEEWRLDPLLGEGCGGGVPVHSRKKDTHTHTYIQTHRQ